MPPSVLKPPPPSMLRSSRSEQVGVSHVFFVGIGVAFWSELLFCVESLFIDCVGLEGAN